MKKKDIIKIVFYTCLSPLNGSSRIHAFQFGPVFKSFGAKVKFNQPYPSNFDWINIASSEFYKSGNFVKKLAARLLHDFLWILILSATRILQIPDVLKYDIVIIQKGVTEHWEHKVFEMIIINFTKALNKIFIYHFDDRVDGKNMTSVTNYLIKKADAVITVNKLLMEYGMKLNKNIFLIPENIKDKEIAPLDKIRQNIAFPIVIGWIGLGGGYKFEALESIGDALSQISKEYTIKLKIVSNMIFSFRKKVNIDIENIEWTFMQEDMFSCDIGINPVPQEMAVEGKGSFKLLKYMAHGIPSVTSWTCDEFNRDEDTCLIASDCIDWYTRLKRLICDDILRVRLATNGINEAKKYSTSVLGLKYFEIITRNMDLGKAH